MKYDDVLLNRVEELLDDNLEIAHNMVREINFWNGQLEWLDVWENDEDFFNCMYENNIMEAVRATCSGDYDYNDDYVRINAYGNVESLSQWELDYEVMENTRDIARAILENYENIDVHKEIEEIVEEYLEEEEE